MSLSTILTGLAKKPSQAEIETQDQNFRSNCQTPIALAAKSLGGKILEKLGLVPVALKLRDKTRDFFLLVKQYQINRDEAISSQVLLQDAKGLAKVPCQYLKGCVTLITFYLVIQFVHLNLWFFRGTLPDQVPGGESSAQLVGLATILSSVLFTVLTILCDVTSRDKCDMVRHSASTAVFPGLLLMFWGMISSAALALEASRRVASEEVSPSPKPELPGVQSNAIYAWALNTFPSQVEGKRVLETETKEENPAITAANHVQVNNPKPHHSTEMAEDKSEELLEKAFTDATMVYFSHHVAAPIGAVISTMCMMLVALPCTVFETM
jgi:hypothetical protein